MWADEGSNEACEVALGSVLVSLLDPEPGREAAFHRWYERDHFYAGVMAGPWFFAGRRFVATRALKDLRGPEASPALDDARRGSYLTLYWILAGHHGEAERWSIEQVQRLIATDRMLPGRRPVHAGFYRHRWTASRDADGVPAELALDHPYAGVALVMLDRAPAAAAELDRWLRDEHLPRTLRGSPAALCLGLEPMPLPEDVPVYIPRPQGLERRALLLYFLESDPRACWKDLFEPLRPAVAATGLATLSLAAPFIPTIPGSDRYADELW
jgi:hypothetical protein